MSEFSVRAAHETPTVFSDDIRTPFEDIGMGSWSHDQIGEYFEGRVVADVGSGREGVARRLYSIFGNSSNAPTVININPQFTDWRMKDQWVNGERVSNPWYKQHDIEAGIKDAMELSGEDYEGYLSQRIAMAALAQQLPLPDDSVDILVSTWAVPTSFYDCDFADRNHVASYREASRVTKADGISLLGPISKGQFKHASEMLDQALGDSRAYEFKHVGSTCGDHREFVIAIG